MPAKRFHSETWMWGTRGVCLWKDKLGHVKNLKSLCKNQRTLGSAKPEVAESAPPTGGTQGETEKVQKQRKEIMWLATAQSPMGCLWLGVLSFSILYPWGIYRLRFWFASVGHLVIRAASVSWPPCLINLTVQSWALRRRPLDIWMASWVLATRWIG